MPLKKRLFELGQTVATPGALAVLEAHGVTYWQLLDRHSTGDWGELPQEDIDSNEFAVNRRLRLLSVYPLGGGDVVWVITEADRSVTTLLLPGDY